MTGRLADQLARLLVVVLDGRALHQQLLEWLKNGGRCRARATLQQRRASMIMRPTRAWDTSKLEPTHQ